MSIVWLTYEQFVNLLLFFQYFKKLQRLDYTLMQILKMGRMPRKGCGDMMSVFKRLIRRELGEGSYNRYFTYIQANLKNKSLESQEVYEDIYQTLKDRDIETIAHMHDRLNETMLLAFRISRTYIYAFIAYLVATIFVIWRGMTPFIAIPTLTAISAAFIFKTYEFVINKYCFIDAQMVLVYKSVLERIIIGHVKSKNF